MNELAIGDLTADEAITLYKGRRERLIRLLTDYRITLNEPGVRLLNRCIFESGAMLRDLKRSAAHSPS